MSTCAPLASLLRRVLAVQPRVSLLTLLGNYSVQFPEDHISTLEKYENVKSVESDKEVTTQ